MSPVSNGTGRNCNLPHWFEKVTLENAVRDCVGEYDRILSVTSECASKPGENYSSNILRLHVDVELLDGSSKAISFVLKAPHDNEMIENFEQRFKLFEKEEYVYHRILPVFEALYEEAGKSVKFAPHAFKIDRDIGVDYVLLEDLRMRNFKNANRVTGFDVDHMRETLKKLAEFHAVSACYVEHYGMYGSEFTVGVFSEDNRDMLKAFNVSGAFLRHLKKWKNCQKYYEKLADSDDYLVDHLLHDQKVDSGEFNVLNHGDCWANNIMFQYDAFGKIKETLFIDFQVGKYGSPANDLYYLILSSAGMDIKLSQFDYLVRYYYDNLVENLTLLQYHRPLPKLKNLHTSLLRNGVAAYMVVTKVLPVVMLDKNENSNLENFIDDSSKMKEAMYTNYKYVQAMCDIMPWLDNRGLLDWI